MIKTKGKKYEQIITAAVKVIAQVGYAQAKVSDIAREAQVADGTIYLYFQNKDHLLISLFQQKMGDYINMVENSLKNVESARDQLYRLIDIHLSYLEKEIDLATVTQLELRQSNPVIRQELLITLKPYMQQIDQIIKRGIEQGLFRTSLDVRLTRRMIFGTLDETVSSWLMNERKYELRDMVKPLYELFVQGVENRSNQ